MILEIEEIRDLTNHVRLETKDISPILLHSYFYSADMNQPKGKRLEFRNIKTYEMEFILESNGGMIIDDKAYDIQKNDIVFRRPGQSTQGILPYRCYSIIFHVTPDSHTSERSIIHYQNPILDKLPLIFNTQRPSHYVSLFEAILKEYINPSNISDLVFKTYILHIFRLLYEEAVNPLHTETLIKNEYYKYIKRALSYIDYHWNQKVTLDDLSAAAELSKNYFLKIFSDTLGVTPNVYLTNYRMDKAKEMLVLSELAIQEIALQCGFENIPYFSYLFKKSTGLSPSEFRKQHHHYGELSF